LKPYNVEVLHRKTVEEILIVKVLADSVDEAEDEAERLAILGMGTHLRGFTCDDYRYLSVESGSI
jgi:hypothetical protein